MFKAILHFIGIMALAFLLIASETRQSAEANAAGQAFISHCASGVTVTMSFKSETLSVYTPVDVTVRIVGADGTPVSDALIFCSFFMPEVATGWNKPKLKALGKDGTYSGVVFFERDGHWLANFTINLPSGDYEEVSFDLGTIKPA
ncbi:MAG: hypothetical protein C0621_06000 [Desulfuromonas sp.]|nr:MAG: hypothetical protein C0621_06000 [Desulfuromonas sp.]